MYCKHLWFRIYYHRRSIWLFSIQLFRDWFVFTEVQPIYQFTFMHAIQVKVKSDERRGIQIVTGGRGTLDGHVLDWGEVLHQHPGVYPVLLSAIFLWITQHVKWAHHDQRLLLWTLNSFELGQSQVVVSEIKIGEYLRGKLCHRWGW